MKTLLTGEIVVAECLGRVSLENYSAIFICSRGRGKTKVESTQWFTKYSDTKCRADPPGLSENSGSKFH